MEEHSKEKGIKDTIKRIVSVGVGAGFMSEEVINKILKDLPLPTDMISGLIHNAKGAKEEFTNGLREEFRKYLTRLDTEALLDYILKNYDVEINAQFRFQKKDKSKNLEKSEATKSAKINKRKSQKDE